jgi:MarR family transcriptional regulator for hemolysin
MAKVDWDLRLGFLIHDVSRLRRNVSDKAFAPLGITRSQWWVLAYLSRKDGMPQTQLAQELDLGKVALGGLIDRLQAGRLVKRRSDPTDRRVKRVFLTEDGRDVIERLRAATGPLNAKMLRGIPPGELEVAAKVLHHMKHNLIELAEDPDAIADKAAAERNGRIRA